LLDSSFAIMNYHRVLPGLGQRRSNLPRQLDFIFDDKDAHAA
jgi:hypothetical protein